MTIFLYSILFAIGTVIGSFCTLAVYRIPRKKDITHERSFCPNCEHKLGFFDLIPVISYVALKGKCRYCREKIRIRYLLLEIFSGMILLLFGMSFHFSVEILEPSKYVTFFFGIFYIVTLTLLAGIDKEEKEIHIPVLLFGVATIGIYILYLSIVEKTNIHRYAIYLFFMFILFCIDAWNRKKRKKANLWISVLILILLFLMYTSTETVLITMIITLFTIAMETMRKKEEGKQKLPIGFYLCVSNLVVLLLQNFVYFY